MADLFRKTKSLFSTTSNSFGSGTGETITLSSAGGLPEDTEITLTFDRSVVGKLERIIGTVSGTNFAIRTSPTSGRGADSTTDQSHTSPTVEYIPNAKDINDMVAGILVEHTQTGAHGATIVKTSGAQTFTGAKTFTTGLLKAVDITSTSASIVFPTSAVTVTLPAATDTLVGKATTDTLSNKRITPRVVTATDDATAVIDVDATDQYQLTAIANATEFTVTGTPVNGQKLIVRLKDAGVAKALTWTGFTAIGCTAPTVTTAGKTHYIGCIYNSATPTWNIVAVIVEA
jgi:hypothetical protein